MTDVVDDLVIALENALTARRDFEAASAIASKALVAFALADARYTRATEALAAATAAVDAEYPNPGERRSPESAFHGPQTQPDA